MLLCWDIMRSRQMECTFEQEVLFLCYFFLLLKGMNEIQQFAGNAGYFLHETYYYIATDLTQYKNISSINISITVYLTLNLFIQLTFMKNSVLPFNIVLSIFYIALTFAFLYLFKIVIKKQQAEQSEEKQNENGLIKDKLNYIQIISKTWIRKCSIFSIFIDSDKKHMIIQSFIVSAYLPCLLKINKLTFWPLSLSIVYLPTCILFLEGSKYMSRRCYLWKKDRKQKQNNNKTVNNAIERAISVQIITIQENTTKHSINRSLGHKDNIFQTMYLSILAYLTVFLIFFTVFDLTNSVSNSGQLNITSFLIIFVLDQLAVRPLLGLLTISFIFNLAKYGFISLSSNQIIQTLCSQEIRLQAKRIKEEMERQKQHQVTSSPLKQNTNYAINNINEIHINMFNLEPIDQNIHQIEDQLQIISRRNIPKDQQLDSVYLTTPQKQLFELEVESEPSETIMKTILDNKQNESISLNKFSIEQDQFSQSIEYPFKKRRFTLDCEDKQREQNYPRPLTKHRGKKPAKRVLNITGSSPYLQYLPNMLKNVDKYKNKEQKVKKIL